MLMQDSFEVLKQIDSPRSHSEQLMLERLDHRRVQSRRQRTFERFCRGIVISADFSIVICNCGGQKLCKSCT